MSLTGNTFGSLFNAAVNKAGSANGNGAMAHGLSPKIQLSSSYRSPDNWSFAIAGQFVPAPIDFKGREKPMADAINCRRVIEALLQGELAVVDGIDAWTQDRTNRKLLKEGIIKVVKSKKPGRPDVLAQDLPSCTVYRAWEFQAEQMGCGWDFRPEDDLDDVATKLAKQESFKAIKDLIEVLQENGREPQVAIEEAQAMMLKARTPYAWRTPLCPRGSGPDGAFTPADLTDRIERIRAAEQLLMKLPTTTGGFVVQAASTPRAGTEGGKRGNLELKGYDASYGKVHIVRVVCTDGRVTFESGIPEIKVGDELVQAGDMVNVGAGGMKPKLHPLVSPPVLQEGDKYLALFSQGDFACAHYPEIALWTVNGGASLLLLRAMAHDPLLSQFVQRTCKDQRIALAWSAIARIEAAKKDPQEAAKLEAEANDPGVNLDSADATVADELTAAAEQVTDVMAPRHDIVELVSAAPVNEVEAETEGGEGEASPPAEGEGAGAFTTDDVVAEAPAPEGEEEAEKVQETAEAVA